jgi:hypothetical protein
MSPVEHKLLNRNVWADVLFGPAIPPELSKSAWELATDLHNESPRSRGESLRACLPGRQAKSYSPRRPHVNCSTDSRRSRPTTTGRHGTDGLHSIVVRLRPAISGRWVFRIGSLEADVRGLRHGARLTTNNFPFVTIMGVFRRGDYPAAAGHRSGR